MNRGRRAKGRVGAGVVCVSLFIVFVCHTSPPPLPSSVSPLAPRVCVADKREEEAGSRHSAVCLGCLPCQARDQVKGPRCGAPPQLLPAFVSPTPPTQQEALLRR